MESSLKINLDMSGLDIVYAACRELEKKVHAGVFTTRNATIAAANEREYGFINDEGVFVPSRSTVRLPLEMAEEQIRDRSLSKLTALTPDVASETIEELGRQAVIAMEDAFDTQGYGQWKDNAAYTIKQKGRNEPMVDTGELRESYSYEVVDE